MCGKQGVNPYNQDLSDGTNERSSKVDPIKQFKNVIASFEIEFMISTPRQQRE